MPAKTHGYQDPDFGLQALDLRLLSLSKRLQTIFRNRVNGKIEKLPLTLLLIRRCYALPFVIGCFAFHYDLSDIFCLFGLTIDRRELRP